MKIIGFLALLVLLFSSLFKLGGADLSNNVLAIALLLTLVTLFSDLKEFNFWGLRGVTKEEKELKDVKGKEGIASTKKPKLSQQRVTQVLKQETVPMMESPSGNFLAYAFEVERLLRVVVSLLTEKKEDASAMSLEKMIEVLKDKKFLTEEGEKQLGLIDWLRSQLVEGKGNEVGMSIIKDGEEVARGFYEEVKEWLDNAAKS